MPTDVNDVSFRDPKDSDPLPVTTPESIHANIGIVPQDEFRPTRFFEKKEHNPASPTDLRQALDTRSLSKLIVVLKRRYGSLFTEWEPETLFAVIKDDIKQEVSNDIKDRILSARVLSTMRPWTEWVAFEKSALALNGHVVIVDRMQRIDPADMAVAIQIMKSAEPKNKFSDEVQRYIAARLHAESMLYIGKTLFPEKVQAYIQQLGVSVDLLKLCEKRYPELKATQEPKEPTNLVDMQVAQLLALEEVVHERA